MKLLGNTKNKITEDENVENKPYCNIVNKDYQHDSGVFVPKRSFGQLLDIWSKHNYVQKCKDLVIFII